MDSSLSEQMQNVISAFIAAFPVPQPSPSEMPGYVEEVFPDYVIVCTGMDNYFKVPYQVDGETITFSPRDQWQAVEEAYVPKEAKALPQASNPLKAIGKTDNELRVGNYIVLFGGRDLEGVATRTRNLDGSRGEFFSPTVQVESPYTKANQVMVDFEHGRDPDGLGLGVDVLLGRVDWKTARRDERGIFVERVLDRRQKYVQYLEELIEAGLIGNSSAAMPGAMEKKANGEITRWGLMRDTLTVQPMEPRMLLENPVAAKALEEIRNLSKTREAAMTDQAGIKTQSPIIKEKATMELTLEQIQTLLKENNTSLLEQVEARTTAAAKAATEEALKSLPEIGKAAATLQVTDAPEDRPFETIAEQAKAIKNFTVSMGRTMHPRLRGLEAAQTKAINEAKALGLNEATPSEGGFMLEPTLSAEFIKPIHEEGVFSRDVRVLPVGTNSNYGWINGIDETSRANGSRWGGVLAYHRAEAAQVTATKPKFRQINWKIDAIEALMYASDEQLDDAAMTDAIMRESAIEEINFIVNDDIFEGDGVGKASGVMNSGALIQVARAATSAISHADILSMWERMTIRSKARAKWYVSNTAYTQLQQLTFTSGSTGILSPYVSYGADGTLVIMGRPVVETEFNAALGTLGDILLADMNQYLFWEKGGIKSSVNPWLQWLTSEQAFKFTYRCDGKTSVASALTPFKGTTTVSPFVTLKATTS